MGQVLALPQLVLRRGLGMAEREEEQDKQWQWGLVRVLPGGHLLGDGSGARPSNGSWAALEAGLVCLNATPGSCSFGGYRGRSPPAADSHMTRCSESCTPAMCTSSLVACLTVCSAGSLQAWCNWAGCSFVRLVGGLLSKSGRRVCGGWQACSKECYDVPVTLYEMESNHGLF